MTKYIMSYTEPIVSNKYHPGDWNQALPLGSGRLGVMVFGGVEREFLQLNEETVWYKGKKDRVNPEAFKHLKEIRDLVMNGEITKAERLIALTMHSTPTIQGHYEPLANVIINMNHGETPYQNYKRSLSLHEAIVNIEYQIDNCMYQREYFSSYEDNLICAKITSNQKQVISFDIDLNRDKNYDEVAKLPNDMISLRAKCGGQHGVTLNTLIKVVSDDGKVFCLGNKIVVENVTTAYIYISGFTDFTGKMPEEENSKIINQAIEKGYDLIKKDHIKEYQQYFNAVSFSMGDDKEEYLVEEMLQEYRDDGENVSLIPLYFQFGRYLLIASSRPNTKPANLRGIWNKEYNPAWDSKYTININTQMNYWPAEVCNLGNCHLPLFDLLKVMLENGKKVAREMYGCKGFVAHHNTDLWGDCAPQGAYISSSQWVMGAAWLSTHIYEHYVFTKDIEFLKEYYDIMKEATLFITNFLIEDKKGYLVTCPSLSPENRYYGKNKTEHYICYAPTCDIEIIKALFMAVRGSAKVLDCDQQWIQELDEIEQKLPPMKIGKFGQLQEWVEDYEEVEPGHRHFAHLLGVYPFNQVDPIKTPELADACIKTIERRAFYGQQEGSGWLTGWARAWMVSIWARLNDGEKAKENIYTIFKDFTTSNLFNMHPPFDIDGNFGTIAGIAEMLLQSQQDEIYLLPSLPNSWKAGSIKGLCARGGYEIDIRWENSELYETTIHAKTDGEVSLRTKTQICIEGIACQEVKLNNTYTYRCHMKSGKQYKIVKA